MNGTIEESENSVAVDRLQDVRIVGPNQTAAKVGFDDLPLAGVGDAAWRELWESARQYSTVAYKDQAYPVVADNSVCVLCQQPLSEEAGKRLVQFEQFVNDDTAKQAKQSKQVFDDAFAAIAALQLWQPQ